MFRFYITIALLVLCLNSCKAIDSDNGASSRIDGLQIERDENHRGTEQQYYDLQNNGKGTFKCPAGYAKKGLC